LKRSIAQKEKIACGEEMPKLMAYNYDHSEVEVNQLIKNSNAVIYFWPKDLGRIEMLNDKLNYLKKHHPDVVFIGIERNKTDDEWRAFVSSKKLPKEHQFLLAKNSETYAWYEGDMERTIIVNNEGKVENGFMFFLDSNLNYYLKNINKR
jgi:peroxiredoxin